MKKKHFGMCGLDCSACEAYIATQNNDQKLREKTAKEWTRRYRNDGRDRPPVKPEDINCRGCLSAGPLYLYCHRCQIRQCGFERGIKNCIKCPDYKGKPLKELQSHFY